MRETAAAIFSRIALEKGLLDETKLGLARQKLRDMRRKGVPYALDRACIDLGLLSEAQVRGIERGLRYYVARKADKAYRRIAADKGLVDGTVLDECLTEQKREFYENHRLLRLSRMLIDREAIDAAGDAAVRQEVLARLAPEESAEEADSVREAAEEEAAAQETASAADEWELVDESRPPAPAARRIGLRGRTLGAPAAPATARPAPGTRAAVGARAPAAVAAPPAKPAPRKRLGRASSTSETDPEAAPTALVREKLRAKPKPEDTPLKRKLGAIRRLKPKS